jgi:hypothetical protein
LGSFLEKMKDIIRKVKGYVGTVGIWAVDRKGDDVNLFHFFDTEQLKFVTRLKLSKWLNTHNINGGRTFTSAYVASSPGTNHQN